MTQEAGTPAGFWDRVEQIAERAVNKYLRAGLLNSASISSGGLTIKGGFLKVLFPQASGGGLGVYFGDIVNPSTLAYQGTGLLVQDADGTDILTARSDVATGNPVLVLRDAAENAVLFTDLVSGQGLARPWFSAGFYPSRATDWIGSSLGAFETLYRAKTSKQNPKLLVRVWGYNDTAGATGEIQILVNGVAWQAAQTTSNSLITERLFFADVPGVFGSSLIVEIQARVVSGTGQTRIAPSELTTRA